MSPHLYASEITPLALILDADALTACIDAVGFAAEYRDLPLGTDDASVIPYR